MKSIQRAPIFLFITFLITLYSGRILAESDKPISLTVLIGGAYNSITSGGDLHYYFSPTATSAANIGYNWALETDFKLSSFFSLVAGLHYEANKGQHTSQTQVQFSSDPTIYDFETITRLDYLSLPINFKIGYTFGDHWGNLRFGPIVSTRVGIQNAWYVDHQNVSNSNGYINVNGNWLLLPDVTIDRADLSFIIGVEYGYRIGMNGFLINLNYEYGLRNIVTSGPSGEAFNRSTVLLIGYKRFF